MASYYNGLELILSLMFLGVVLMESITRRTTRIAAAVTVIGWQLPAVVLSLLIITGLAGLLPGGEYYIFILELWYTPVLPLVSLAAAPFLPEPVYYEIILGLPLLLSFYYLSGQISVQPQENKMIRR